MKLPTLYKRNSDGSINFWEIESYTAQEGPNLNGQFAGVIKTTWGQLGTDSPQVTTDPVSQGTNVGKKNERSPIQQAEFEANAKWTKQLKKGYVKSKEEAEAGQVDSIIEGGVAPMLCHKYKNHAQKIKFPCFVQPKLDGMRCVAVLQDGRCTLWSRTRKPINSCPHVQREIENAFQGCNLVLDGELYNHDLKDNLEAIISLARQDEPEAGHETIQFHCYDITEEGTFKTRYEDLLRLFAGDDPFTYLKIVPCLIAQDAQGLDLFFQAYLEDRYEGAIARNADGQYVNKRSYDVQKLKPSESEEFEIVGAKDGRGKMAGLLAKFVCKTKDGNLFEPPFNAPLPRLKEMYENREQYIGKMLTVEFLRWSHTDKPVPYGCKGKVVRDYE